MVDLILTILALTMALLFTKYMAHCIIYFFAKFVRFISKGKINMILHPITFDDVLSTAMLVLIISAIFKIVGII